MYRYYQSSTATQETKIRIKWCPSFVAAVMIVVATISGTKGEISGISAFPNSGSSFTLEAKTTHSHYIEKRPPANMPEKRTRVPHVLRTDVIVEMEPIRYCRKILAGKTVRTAVEQLNWRTKKCHHLDLYDISEPANVTCPKGLEAHHTKCVGLKTEPMGPQCHKKPGWWFVPTSSDPTSKAYLSDMYHEINYKDYTGYCIMNEVYFPPTHCAPGFRKTKTSNDYYDICIKIREKEPVEIETCSYFSVKDGKKVFASPGADASVIRRLSATNTTATTPPKASSSAGDIDGEFLSFTSGVKSNSKNASSDSQEALRRYLAEATATQAELNPLILPGADGSFWSDAAKNGGMSSDSFTRHCEKKRVCPVGFGRNHLRTTCVQVIGTSPLPTANCTAEWYWRRDLKGCMRSVVREPIHGCPVKYIFDPITNLCTRKVKEAKAMRLTCPTGYFNRKNVNCVKITRYEPAVLCEHLGGFTLDEKKQKCVLKMLKGMTVHALPPRPKKKKKDGYKPKGLQHYPYVFNYVDNSEYLDEYTAIIGDDTAQSGGDSVPVMSPGSVRNQKSAYTDDIGGKPFSDSIIYEGEPPSVNSSIAGEQFDGREDTGTKNNLDKVEVRKGN